MVKEIANPEKAFEDALAAAAGMPGVRIDREAFLRSSLKKYFDEQMVDAAIEQTPAKAGIPFDQIKRIANESINFETAKVTALSTAAGIPGGLAMLGTVPADLAQYYAHVLRVTQKIAYLYGWPSLFDENGEMDDGTKSILTLFLGVMSGVEMAGRGVANVADMLAIGIAKKLPQRALTKGAVYPIVKKVAGYLGVQMTKQTFAKGVSKVVPVVGGAVSGGLTFATFRPMSAKLRDYLAGLPLAGSAKQVRASDGATATVGAVVEVAADVVDIDPVVPANAAKEGSAPAAGTD
jgi:hypothetical protein